MTYRGIDKGRFSYLLMFGTDGYELRKFFADCRIQLIQRGARVQNLPSGDKARIRVLAYELPSATDEVVRNWFGQHLTMSDPDPVNSVIDMFKLHEEVGEELDEETARRLARSCLVHLFGEAPPSLLLEFMKTPLGGGEKVDQQAEQEPDKQTAQVAVDASRDKDLNLANLVAVMVDLVKGHDVDQHLDGLPAEIAALALGLHAAAEGQFDDAREALSSLPSDAVGKAALDQFIRQQELRGRKQAPKGPVVAVPQHFSNTFDFENDEILGYCTKADSPNAVFVHPIAVVRANVVQLFASDVSRRLFPTNGDVMAFAGARYPRQPRRGEVGIWHVEEHETEKATRFHITGDQRNVHELVSLPFASADYDSVREYIKEYTQRTLKRVGQPRLFVLADGLIVGGRTERSDLSKDEAFESGLLSWDSLPAWRLEGRLFVLGPLPKEQGVYECGSIGSSIRKLLRPFLGSGGKPSGGLTKAQLSELAQLLSSGEVELTSSRIQRIKSELGRLDDNIEALSALVDQILVHPSVRARVDDLIKQEVTKRVAEKSELQQEIARLYNERGEWEERVQKQRDEHRRLRDETAKVVRGAFEKARSEGIATLAELAIFQELTGSGNKPDGAPQAIAHFQPMVRLVSKSDATPISVLKVLGVSAQRATALTETAKLALSSGLLVCVRGLAARLAVERFAQSLGSAAIIEATVGLLDDAPIRNLLNGATRPDAIALLDANLSALDIYARPLADAVIDSISTGQVCPTAFLLSLSDSVGKLPLPRSFERLSVTLDLEANYDFGISDVTSLLDRVFDIEEGILQMRLWAPAVQRMQEQLTHLDREIQSLVLPVLAGVTRPDVMRPSN